jgi:hypothetical protein
MGVPQFAKPEIIDRDPSAADDDGGPIEFEPVHQVSGEKGRSGLCSPLDIEILNIDEFADGLGRCNRARAFDVSRGQHPALRTAILEACQPHVELRRIGAPGAATDEDRVGHGAARMDMRPCFGPGDPAAGSICQRGAAVERKRKFESDMRAAPLRPCKIARQTAATSQVVNTPSVDPGRSQTLEPQASSPRVGVAHPGDYSCDARRQQFVGAGGAAARSMRARLERHIGRCARRPIACLRQRHCFGMRAPARLRPAAPNHDSILDEEGPDGGVGTA